MVFSGSSGFLQEQNWPPRNSWNIVESDVKNTIKPILDHHIHTNLQSLIKQKYCSLILSINQIIDQSINQSGSIRLCYITWTFIKYKKKILLHNMHLFVYIQYSILSEPSLLSISRSNDSLSSDTSWPHRHPTYVFLSGTGHSSLNSDNYQTTNHL